MSDVVNRVAWDLTNWKSTTPVITSATWAEVNLPRLSQNLQAIRAQVAPAKVMIVVKANAYGHGLAEVARHLAPQADYIGVAVLEEGIFLRETGCDRTHPGAGRHLGRSGASVSGARSDLTASSVERLEQIESAGRADGHSRQGPSEDRYRHGADRRPLLQCRASLAGSCTEMQERGGRGHLLPFRQCRCPDLTHARLQLERFQRGTRFYERNSLPMPIRHMANSAAILQLPESHLDMVRPGIMLYGVYPDSAVKRTVMVQPALAWKSRVVYFKVVRAGPSGQLRLHLAVRSPGADRHHSRSATGTAIFADLSNKASVIIRGKKYPEVGRVCMDQIMVNIESDSAFNGDEVTLIGESDGEEITAQDLAEWAGTIPYEILTNINTRVPRVYVT